MSIVIDEVIADVQSAPSPASPDTPDTPDTSLASATPAATPLERLALQALLREREARLAFD